ncbi:MAG: radical SAM protein with 4Fe4S-binding SPASM domain [Salibacteraceae bacterium]|jgi:radical SAM protein with 4Fe4S-binding SPASM domain
MQDRKLLFKKLSTKKIVNGLKLISGYYASRITKKPLQWGMPISMSIEPTTACNLGCPECPSGLKMFSRPTGNLDPKLFETIIEQVKDTLVYLTFYFQGEPFINKNFLGMVKYASDRKIFTATSTNAHFINDKIAEEIIHSGLDHLIISMDGTTQEVYEQYRVNGKLAKVIQGTENIIAAKKRLKSATPKVIFQFLVVQHNEHQIDDLYELADQLGVDQVALKTAQVYDYKNGSDLFPTNEKYSRYKKNAQGFFEIKNKLRNHCWRLWHSTVITWDGDLVPCCFDKDAKYKMGTLKNHTFKEIWHDKTYKSFRNSIIQSRKNIDICQNCTEGTKVWM